MIPPPWEPPFIGPMSYRISLDEHEMSTLPLHETSPAAAPDPKQDIRRYCRNGGGRRDAPWLLKPPQKAQLHPELLPPDWWDHPSPLTAGMDEVRRRWGEVRTGENIY